METTGAKDQYDNVYGIKTKEELIEFSQIFFRSAS